jgi:hypothetical protein
MRKSGRIEISPQRLKPPRSSAAYGTTEVVPFPIPRLAMLDGRWLAAQLADDCGDVVLLEEADGGYAGCAGFQAGLGILQGYASEG